MRKDINIRAINLNGPLRRRRKEGCDPDKKDEGSSSSLRHKKEVETRGFSCLTMVYGDSANSDWFGNILPRM